MFQKGRTYQRARFSMFLITLLAVIMIASACAVSQASPLSSSQGASNGATAIPPGNTGPVGSGSPLWFAKWPQITPVLTSENQTYSLIVNKDVQPFGVQLKANPNLNRVPDKPGQTGGWIEITKQGQNAPGQKLEVKLENATIDWIASGLQVEDADFDGYLDIGVQVDGGARWGQYQWWLYDKDEGRFVTNTLSQEISSLQYGFHWFDPSAKEIHTQNSIGMTPVGEVYQIVDGHLKLVREEGNTAN